MRIGKAPEQRCGEKRRKDPHYYRILKTRFDQHLLRIVKAELISSQVSWFRLGTDWRGF